MLSVRKFIVAGAVAALFSSARAAEGAMGGQQSAQKGACKADAQKLCKDVQPGEGKMLSCLRQHQSELSPKCQSNIKQVQAAVKQVSASCEPDIEQFCFNTPIGKGGIASCLKKHSAELSADCKSAMSKAKSKK